MKKSPKFLLDTNICIFILRNNRSVIEKILEAGIDSCAISEITVAELLYGVECSKNGIEERRIVEEFCRSIKVYPISGCLSTFASQKSILRGKGELIDDFDLLIGSTAIFYNLVLVTDNKKHFERLPLPIENWVSR